MGTGVPGGGGGGGGGAARGGGGNYGDGGGFSLSFSGENDPDRELEQAIKVVLKTLNALPKEYIALQFANPFLDKVYNEIFFLKVDLLTNKSWDRLTTDFGIPGDAGCLTSWVGEIVALNEKHELEQRHKVVETVQMALEDFSIAMVNDDIDVFLYGDSASVIKAATKNRQFLESIAGYFLSFLIWRVVEREKETLLPNVELKVHDACKIVANTIISAYENEFFHTRLEEIEMTTHQNLFFTFAKRLDWLIDNFKKWAK